jgi:hypothetical protein
MKFAGRLSVIARMLTSANDKRMALDLCLQKQKQAKFVDLLCGR